MALDEATNPVKGVSGPGKFSKRTDIKYQPDAYGDGVAMAEQKAGAPLSKAPKSPMLSQAPQVSAPQAPVTGLYEPTQRPNEPVTHGINVGAGGGSDVLNMQDATAGQYQTAYDIFQSMAQSPNATPALQYLAQRIQQGF